MALKYLQMAVSTSGAIIIMDQNNKQYTPQQIKSMWDSNACAGYELNNTLKQFINCGCDKQKFLTLHA